MPNHNDNLSPNPNRGAGAMENTILTGGEHYLRGEQTLAPDRLQQKSFETQTLSPVHDWVAGTSLPGSTVTVVWCESKSVAGNFHGRSS